MSPYEYANPMDQVALIEDAEVSFIGDVHGWQQRLEELLPRCRGHLVFLGDLIDRGPQSREVIGCVRDLVDQGRASCVMGNHEYALIRGVGLPSLGIPGHSELFTAWWQRYGGDVTANSYGVDVEAEPHPEQALREAMGEDLAFLAELPWYLWGEAVGHPWLAVHAGLNDLPYRAQLNECARHRRWLRQDLPRFLYAKDRCYTRPEDLPEAVCLVSGHVPQRQALVSPQRILADTSGGYLSGPLSAVIWPSGEVVSAHRVQPL